MPLSLIQQVRIEVADISVEFPLLDDNTYQYFLDKNLSNIRKSALDAAKTIMLLLSMRGEETVDIFSIKGSKAAEQYRLALAMYISNPALNPVLSSVNPYAGGISLTDMTSNIENVDNNYVKTPYLDESITSLNTDNPFVIQP